MNVNWWLHKKTICILCIVLCICLTYFICWLTIHVDDIILSSLTDRIYTFWRLTAPQDRRVIAGPQCFSESCHNVPKGSLKRGAEELLSLENNMPPAPQCELNVLRCPINNRMALQSYRCVLEFWSTGWNFGYQWPHFDGSFGAVKIIN